jgi:hypothetical protein
MTAFRSKFEQRFAADLKTNGVPVVYEQTFVSYTVPASDHRYTPDFRVNETYIETKGVLKIADRKKMLLVKEQHPDKKFILVFQNWNNKICKGSKTTYKMWAEKNGFECYNEVVPASRLKELAKNF